MVYHRGSTRDLQWTAAVIMLVAVEEQLESVFISMTVHPAVAMVP